MSDRETDEDSGDTTDAISFSLYKKKKLVSEEDELVQDTYNIEKFPYFAKPIIFNHKRFSKKHSIGLKPVARQGTSMDEKKLQHLFHGLNCQAPEIYKDNKLANIEKILQEVAQADHSEVACIIIVVLTHGDENELYAYDTTYETCKLWEPFTKKFASNESLAGKPKLFIIQACRGSDIDDAQDVPDAKCAPEATPPKRILKNIPRCADFFIAHSSFLGYMSVRNTLNGSWFIQTFCRAIEQYKNRLDLLSIMTIVKHNIAYNKTYNKDKKQIPCTETTLTKSLFLSPAAKKIWADIDTLAIEEPGIDRPDSFKIKPVKGIVDTTQLSQAVPNHMLNKILPFQSNDCVWLFFAVAAIFIAWLLKANVQCNCVCGEHSNN